MRHVGKIIAVNGNIAEIEITKSNQCAGCTACNMWDTKGPLQLLARNNLQAQIGDRVEVEVAPAQVVSSSLIVFLFPLLARMLGYWLGAQLAPGFRLRGESGGILGSLIFLVASFGGIFIYDRFVLNKNKTNARIESVVSRQTIQDPARCI